MKKGTAKKDCFTKIFIELENLRIFLICSYKYNFVIILT